MKALAIFPSTSARACRRRARVGQELAGIVDAHRRATARRRPMLEAGIDRAAAGIRPRAARRRRSRPTAPCSRRTASGTSPRTTTSETAKRPPGFSTRNASRSTRRLVGRQVDDAVGDDDVDAAVGQRDVLDLSLQELDVRRARPSAGSRAPARASRRSCRDRTPCRWARRAGPTAARRCRRRTQVEHRLAWLQLDQRRRIAAAERRGDRVSGKPAVSSAP